MDDADTCLICCMYSLNDILVIGQRKKVNINSSAKTEPQTGIIIFFTFIVPCIIVIV